MSAITGVFLLALVFLPSGSVYVGNPALYEQDTMTLFVGAVVAFSPFIVGQLIRAVRH